MTTVLDGPDALRAAAGTHLGVSDWLTIDQDRINLFADATGDHQWIHVDVERATAGPFGAPIAHGNLTLALSNLFLPQIVEVRGFEAGVNYGVDRVRYPSPVPVGSARARQRRPRRGHRRSGRAPDGDARSPSRSDGADGEPAPSRPA